MSEKNAVTVCFYETDTGLRYAVHMHPEQILEFIARVGNGCTVEAVIE